KTEFKLVTPFRTQVRIADVARSYRTCATRHVGWNCRESRWLQAALTIGGAELHRGNPRNVEERLFTHYPGNASLRVIHEVEVLSERAVVVRANAGGEEQPVVPGELLLEEHADRVVLDLVVVTQREKAQGAERLEPWRRESLAVHRTGLRGAGVVLRTQ